LSFLALAFALQGAVPPLLPSRCPSIAVGGDR